MAKTAVVNKKKKGAKKRRRRRNYGAAAANPKRRRRRNMTPAPRRRYNTGRRKNPGMFDFDSLMDTVPAATGGVWLGRWGTKMAGPFEDGEPGFKHAIAIAIAASVGGDMVGNMLGSASKGEYARIACLGYGGDLFMRKRFMRDSTFVNENLSLEGLGVDDPDDYYEEGDDPDDAVGQVDTMVDAMGNEYVMTDQGWQLAQNVQGFSAQSAIGQAGGQVVVGEDGNLYQLDGTGGMGAHQYPANYAAIMESMAGFQNQSSLGMAPARAEANNSFGYR